MNPKLRLMLLNSPRKSGFALPMTLIIGLVMLLIGVAMIVRSQSDQSKAMAQKDTAVGLSVAEVGIARYQDLLNQNKYFAIYDACINDPETNYTFCNEVPESQACENGEDFSDLAEQLGTGWKSVDENDPSKGQYRLISYNYEPTPPTMYDYQPGDPDLGEVPGIGTLILEGKIKQNNQNATATSRVEVKIPIEETPPDEVGIPGVWLKTGALGNNNPVEGDVLLNDCGANLNTVNITGTNPDTGEPYEAKHTILEFPELPSIPISAINLDTLQGTNFEFPKATDSPTTQQMVTIDGEEFRIDTYQYVVEEISLQSGNRTISIHTGEKSPGVITKVVFHINGNINKGGEIRHSCAGVDNCKPTDFQIFGHGDDTKHICLNGENQVEAFILAPNYTVGVGGAGSGGGIKGTVWANQWSNNGGCGSNTNNVVVKQTAKWEDLAGLEPKNLPPKIKSISEWTRQEAE